MDILHFLVNYSQPARRICAVVSVSGPVNGSPLADDFAGVYRKIFSRYDIALPVRERLDFGGYYSRAGARKLLFEAIVLTVAAALNSP